MRFGPLLCAVCFAVASASAQQSPGPAAAPSLTDLVRNLDAPEAQTRLDAAESIFQSAAITLKQVEGVLRKDPLSPEQRQRLLGIAARRFNTEPRAAMGIQNDGNLGSHGVSIAFLQPGFPAAQVLKLGDRIIAAAGVTIDTWETMRAVIISRDPGDEIPITVVREGATLNLTVGLGDFTRLRQPSALDPSILAEAWRLRSRDLQDLELAKAAPIESGLPAAAWASQFTLLPDEASDFGATRPGDEGAIALVAGGEPRGGVQGPIQPPIVQRNFNQRGLPGQNRFIPAPGPQGAPQDAAMFALQQQMLALRSLLQDRQAQLDALNRQLADPTLPPGDRRLMRSQIDALSAQIQVISENIRRLDQQLNPRRVR